MTTERVTKAMRTRSRIVDSAAHEIAQHGFDGTSLRQVAANAGLQLGSLYFHFPSKDELLTEVMREAVDLALVRIDAAIDDLGPTADGPARMRVAIAAHLEVLHQSRDLGVAVVRVMDPGATAPEPAIGHARRYVTRWRQIVAESRPDGHGPDADEDRLTSVLLIGAMNATVGRRPQTPEDITRIAAAVQNRFVPA